MAVSLSVKAESLLKQIEIQPQIVLDIEGIDLIFGAMPVLKVLEWDDDNAFWDNGLFWDGSIEDTKSRDVINLNGTTDSITQQIEPDKGSINSISTVNVTLVDKNGEISKSLALNVINEILGKKATFSFGFSNANYPNDFTPIFRGVVVDFYTDSGNIMVGLASSNSFLRQTVLQAFNTELSGNINNSQTVIQLNATEGLIQSQDILTSYIRIDDEIMQLSSIDSETQVTVVRSQLTSLANTHDDDATVDSFYRIQGKPLEIALKMMLSTTDNAFFDSDDIPKSINFVSPIENLNNALIFDYYDIKEKTGLVIGDFIKLNSPSNTGTYTIADFGTLESGDSFIIVNETLVTESEYSGTFCYNSKYNTLPNGAGLGMLSSEVDVEEFEAIINRFGSNFVDIDAYIKDTIDDATNFIKDKLFSQGLYLVFRKARTSVKYTVPPFTSAITKTLDIDSVKNINKIKQRRSTHKYLYNTYVYKFNEDSVDNKFLSGKVVVSELSASRIKVGRKQLKIEDGGLRNNPATINMINNVSRRLIDRYRYAPTYIDNIEVLYKDGYKLEIGDVVPFGGSNTQFTNLDDGSRELPVALYEVKNKKINVKNGNISLSLLSTNFAINARYAVVSFSSNVGVGSSNTEVVIKKTLDTEEFFHESDKYQVFLGQKIRVRSKDYMFDETVVLKEVKPTDVNKLVLETPLSFIPQNDYIVEIPEYDNTNINNESEYKLRFAYHNAQIEVVNGISVTEFEVVDASQLVIGSQIYVHSKDYTFDSFEDEVEISNIVGNIVTVNKPLSFIPLAGHLVERSDYLDGGFPYLLI